MKQKTEYIKIKGGRLLAYRNGFTIAYGKDNWKLANAPIHNIMISGDIDYVDLSEQEVANKYGLECIEGAEQLLDMLVRKLELVTKKNNSR